MTSIDVTAMPLVRIVDQFANLEYWQAIIGAVQDAAKADGLEFVEGAAPAELSPNIRDRIGFAAAYARQKFLFPKIKEETIINETHADIESGFAWVYVNSVLAALMGVGIALVEDPFVTLEPGLNADQRSLGRGANNF